MEFSLPDFVVPTAGGLSAMGGDPATPSTPDAPRVIVLTRVGCHLCEEAEASIASICTERGVRWQTIDVDADPRLRAQFTDHVPVTFVDGVQLSIWFLDPDALRAALAS